MRRILVAAILLLILVGAWGAWGGCQDRPKDEVPTQIEPLPKEQPRPIDDRSPL